MRCRICLKEMKTTRVKIGEATNKKMGRTITDVEGVICDSCSKSEWGDGERKIL